MNQQTDQNHKPLRTIRKNPKFPIITQLLSRQRRRFHPHGRSLIKHLSPEMTSLQEKKQKIRKKQKIIQQRKQQKSLLDNFVELNSNGRGVVKKQTLQRRLFFQKIVFKKDNLFAKLLDNLWKNVRKWDVQEIVIDHRKCSYDRISQSLVLTTFKFIHCPKLMILTVTSSHLESIEVIAMINAPNLKHLNLCLNRITNISPLRRANFPYLKKIQLWGNLIQPCRSISQFNFPSLSFKGIDSFYIKQRRQILKSSFGASRELRTKKILQILLDPNYSYPDS